MKTMDKTKTTKKVPNPVRSGAFSNKPVVIEIKVLEKREPIKKHPKAKYD